MHSLTSLKKNTLSKLFMYVLSIKTYESGYIYEVPINSWPLEYAKVCQNFEYEYKGKYYSNSRINGIQMNNENKLKIYINK